LIDQNRGDIMGKKSAYIVTIDVGTGSGRCIIFDLEGTEITSSQQEWLPKTNAKYPGSQDFDTREAWRLLCRTINDALGKAKIGNDRVVAVTSTSMREGMVLYNKDKEVIWACPNVDARAGAEVVDMVNKDLARPIYNIAGDWPSIISPPRFRWIRNKMPEVYEEIAHVNMLSDWVLFKLSGEIVTDPSIGSSSGIFDLSKRAWSQQVIEIADLPSGIYPEVFECGSIVGTVTANAASDTGLREGTPVVTGGADTQLALVGAGAIKPKTYTVCAGTMWQTTVLSDHPLVDPQYRLRALCHAVPGQWMTEGIGFYHGFTMRWFRDGFCQYERTKAQEEGSDVYVLMEKLAEGIPAGSNGVQAIFSNIMDVKQWRHAPPALIGFDVLNPQASGKAACIRAIEESAAYVTRGHIEILNELIGEPATEVTLTGGSSKGFLWPKIIADTLGVSVKIPVIKESTSLGAAMCVLMAIGECSSWAEAVGRLVKWDRHLEPDRETHAKYNDGYKRWIEVYSNIVPIGDKGILPSLWRGPGV
jgi:autoinducer 2 (AI-2) kinase